MKGWEVQALGVAFPAFHPYCGRSQGVRLAWHWLRIASLYVTTKHPLICPCTSLLDNVSDKLRLEAAYADVTGHEASQV